MKTTKRLLCLVLCLVMLLTVAPITAFADDMTPPDEDVWGDITDPDAAPASLALTLVASAAQLSAGDTVEYTVYAEGSGVTTVQFVLSVPEGMTFVAGSGRIPEETKELFGWSVMSWTESNQTWIGYDVQTTDVPQGTPLLTFSCQTVAAGTYQMQLTNAMYCDDKFASFTPEVTADTVTVTGFKDTYYLVGHINGADYGCESDAGNMGTYRFENGTLAASFETDSEVFLKTEGNGKWFLADSDCTDTTVIFREGGQGKLLVPGGGKVIFTLTENVDGTVTLSYVPVMTTVYFDNAGTGWDQVYVYACSDAGELNGTWPGTPMDRLEGDIYSCQVSSFAKQVVFSNGSDSQSAELTLPADGKDLYNLQENAWRVYNDGSSCSHSFVDYISNNDATCSMDGTKTAKCAYCDRTDTVTDVGSAFGHLFEDQWQVEIPNACEDEGVLIKVCTRCGARGGDWLTENLPACTNDDYINNMDKTFPTIFVPGTVKYVITLDPDTDLEEGFDYLYFYAQDADGELTLVEKCTGMFGEKVITVDAPAVVVKMTTDRTNSYYGFAIESVMAYHADGYEVLPAAGHSYETAVTAPNCTRQGFTNYTCTVCGHRYQDDYVPALGHELDPDAWVQTLAPTCSRFGKEDNYCIRCRARSRRNVDMLPHTFGEEWTVVKEETCTEDGFEVRTCTACGAEGVSDLKEVSHLPHLYTYEYANNMSKVFPTVTVPGVDQLVLHFSSTSELESGSDYLYVFPSDNVYSAPVAYLTGALGNTTVTIPGDTFTMWLMTDGVITRSGFQVKALTCYYTDCYRVRPATGHSWNDATCTDPVKCGSCGATEGEALGHSWVDATCTAPKYCSVCEATEGEALGHGEPEYTDNGDTHSAVYPCCGGIVVENEGHTFVNGECICGATDVVKNGLVAENGGLYYYVDGVLNYAGLIEIDGDYYYIRSNGQAVTDRTFWITRTNGLMAEGSYEFGADGKMDLRKNGLVAENGGLYYYVNGKLNYAGLIKIDGDYYYIRSSGQAVTGRSFWITKTNGLKAEGNYEFDADGKMNLQKNGLVAENGGLYYYVNGSLNYAGLIEVDGAYYYIRSNGQAVTGRTFWITKTNDLMPEGSYEFDADGKMNRNGLYAENGGLYYYVNNQLNYAGLIEIDGAYYYIRSNGQAVTGRTFWITKTNDLMAEGSYEFGADGKMLQQKDGIIREADGLYYYVNGKRTYGGLILVDGNYYYTRSSGQVVANQTFWITKTNDLLPEGNYEFDENGVMINAPV